MVTTIPFKRLILRAVLRQVSPRVIRLLSVPDDMNFPEFHEVLRGVLGWSGDLGYIIRVLAKSSTASAGRLGRKRCMN